MIELTRLNGHTIMVNSDLIKTAESSPDTMLTLINGEKLIVREDCDTVTERVLAYRAKLLAEVARKPQAGIDLQRAASLTSVDFSEQASSPRPGQKLNSSF